MGLRSSQITKQRGLSSWDFHPEKGGQLGGTEQSMEMLMSMALLRYQVMLGSTEKMLGCMAMRGFLEMLESSEKLKSAEIL